MNRCLILALAMAITVLFSCSPPPPVYTAHNVSVPFHAQGSWELCQPASLWMVSDWVANNYGGYYDDSFIVTYYSTLQANDTATEQNIVTFLQNRTQGMTWDLLCPQYTSLAYGDFLYLKTNITTLHPATLNIRYTSSSAQDLLKYELGSQIRPVIAFFYDGSNTGHVVVATGYDDRNGTLETVRYSDPWYGPGRSYQASMWDAMTTVTSYYSTYWMTMSFPILDSRSLSNRAFIGTKR